MHTLKNKLIKLFFNTISFLLAFPILICAFLSRCFTPNHSILPRLVWGSTPIINNSYWSRSFSRLGYSSETFTNCFYQDINKRDDWDRLIKDEFKWLPSIVKPFAAFVQALFRYDVFFISFDGFFLGTSPIWFLQAYLLKLAKKKIVLIPYGSDSYIYQSIRSTTLVHGLLMSYPQAAKTQAKIRKRVDYWVKHADAVVPGFMGPDGFGRWDVLIPSPLFIDLDSWQASKKSIYSNGIDEEVVIVHAPNHMGFKGSEFILEAVQRLKNEGLKVRLKLIRGMQNTEVRRVLQEEADILVEQLIFTGHGLNGLEGMASALPTISNLEDENYILPLRRWSYFTECPLVSATPENLIDVLRKLITCPSLRQELGQAGRAYVEKYHGLDSSYYLFSNIIEYIYGRKESLINLYHPILGDYPNRAPKITHSLMKNRVPD